MKKILCLILFLNLSQLVWAESTTLYMRNDLHTINGLEGWKLGTVDTTGGVGSNVRIDDGGTITFDYDILIRHSNGSTTSLGTGVAQTSRAQGNTYGHQEATWNCPETSLVATDAIELIMNIGASGVDQGIIYIITPQLGWTKLEASTWTIKRYTFIYDVAGAHGGGFLFGGTSGDPPQDSTDCKITNIQYAIYSDIGLRIYTSGGVVKIGVQDLDGHQLRIRKGDTIYGIPLLDVEDDNASAVRIYSEGVKALPVVD